MSEMQAGLLKAHKLLSTLHDEIEEEHNRTRGWLFGLLPRRRHYEIIGASRALTELGQRIVDAHRAEEVSTPLSCLALGGEK
jgi:hypothetical protein